LAKKSKEECKEVEFNKNPAAMEYLLDTPESLKKMR